MADHSAIEWTDVTWNPTVGCDKVSAGCTHCYAITQAYRLEHGFKQWAYQGLTRKLPDGSVNWTGVVRTLPERLVMPFGWKKPTRVFVDSMSDLFHPDVPYEFIAAVFGVMLATPQHTYQVLTKRPARMLEFMAAETDRVWGPARGSWCGYQAYLRVTGATQAAVTALAQTFDNPKQDWPPRNIWLGVSVEDQRAADERIPLLLQTPAAVRFLSCEPLIGPVVLFDTSEGVLRGVAVIRSGGQSHDGPSGPSEWFDDSYSGIDWVIAGGESGPNHRPMDLDWARSLRDQCQAAGVAFHFKQIGGRTHAAGGRLLDGRTWDEFPMTDTGAFA